MYANNTLITHLTNAGRAEAFRHNEMKAQREHQLIRDDNTAHIATRAHHAKPPHMGYAQYKLDVHLHT